MNFSFIFHEFHVFFNEFHVFFLVLVVVIVVLVLVLCLIVFSDISYCSAAICSHPPSPTTRRMLPPPPPPQPQTDKSQLPTCCHKRPSPRSNTLLVEKKYLSPTPRRRMLTPPSPTAPARQVAYTDVLSQAAVPPQAHPSC